MATPSKDLPQSEAIALHARLARELRAAGLANFFNWGVDGEEYPLVEDWQALTPKVRVLLSMLMRTRAASARVGRARVKAERKAGPEGVGQLFDDTLHDRAHQQLKAAAVALRNGAKAFAEHAENIQQLLRGAPIDEPSERGWARIAADLGKGVEALIEKSRVFDGCRDIASAAEWDELLTDFAMELSDFGFTDTEIAALLLNMEDCQFAD